MATICKREYANGQVKYQAKIRIKGHPSISETFERKTDAAKWARNTEKAIEDGIYFKTLESRKHTLGELIDRYIEDVVPHKFAKKRDIDGAITHLNWWKDKLGSYFLIDVTPVLLAEYRDKLKKEPYKKFKRTSNKTENKKAEENKQQEESKEVERIRSNSTVNRYMGTLSSAFTIAMNDFGWLEENPMFKVKKKKEPRGRVRYLSEKERNALLAACEKSSNPNLYIVVVLALTTGARFSEIISLKWENIDFKRKYLYLLNTKNNERRSIPISAHAYKLLEEYKKIRRINTKYVFPGKTGKKPIELKRQWENAIEVAKLEDFHFHDLRHTAASYLAMNGASLLEIAHVLGHKTLEMVKRYSHLSEQHTAGILERLSEQQFKPLAESSL